VVVGLALEARLLSPLGDRVRVAIGGVSRAGTRLAVNHLLSDGVEALLSFGLAAALDPRLSPGDLLVPAAVLVDDILEPADPNLRGFLGTGITAPLLHSDVLVDTVSLKASLRRQTGCESLDMESGHVAQMASAHGLPFAVLRAVCDPAHRPLPPAAMRPPLPDGRIDGSAIAMSLLRRPGQLPDLVRLGRDARAARSALARRVERLAAYNSET
jgi:adenosylhomocysteine nucleosidase